MGQFNIGDFVRIREFRDEYKNQSPGFIVNMKELCGQEFVISQIQEESGWIRYNGWSWHEDWLEPVEVEEETDIDVEVFDSVLLMTKG